MKSFADALKALREVVEALEERLTRWGTYEQALFIGGVADGMRLPIARGASEWSIPTRDGEYRYKARRRVGGTFMVLER